MFFLVLSKDISKCWSDWVDYLGKSIKMVFGHFLPFSHIDNKAFGAKLLLIHVTMSGHRSKLQIDRRFSYEMGHYGYRKSPSSFKLIMELL